MALPPQYDERVYAGWLGKCIGVRFGAPIEGWTATEIREHLGELTTYLPEQPGHIFQPDDDTALPLILIRALEDYGPQVSAAQIGETWLNYLGDQHGTLWWGSYGVSTEHTAYLNLAAGIPAPRSGSIALNGAALAEQIGGQIFSDIWGWVHPDDPARAADAAQRASSVSHDGSGLHGGRFIAALVSAAFVERDPRALIDSGLAQIPPDSEYARVVSAMLDCHTRQPDDWRAAYQVLHTQFGYDRYPGVVHIIPNAGVVALGLLYGAGDFSRALCITTMCGWDTDCNVGNVGAIMGTALGVDGIDAAWRAPLNDVLVAASLIGTRNLLTLPQCADLFCALGRAAQGAAPIERPRYHFAYPGSTGGFTAHDAAGRPLYVHRAQIASEATLQTSLRGLAPRGAIRLATRTYCRPAELSGNYYEACFTPLIYPGQTVTARLYLAPEAPEQIEAALYALDDNHARQVQAEGEPLTPGRWHTLRYHLPPLEDACLSEVGVVLRSARPVEQGSVHLAALEWSGPPDFCTTFACERPEAGGISQWTRLRGYWRLDDGAYHGSGPGLCESYSGDVRWTDYTCAVELVPLVGEHHALLARVQGALRSYVFGLGPDRQIVLYKNERTYRPVAAAPFDWVPGTAYRLTLSVEGAALIASASGPDGLTQTIRWVDDHAPYLHGQIGLSTGPGGHTRFQTVRTAAVAR